MPARVCSIHGAICIESNVTRQNRSGLICSVTGHRLLQWNVVSHSGTIVGVGSIEEVSFLAADLERMALALAAYAVRSPRRPNANRTRIERPQNEIRRRESETNETPRLEATVP